MSFSSRLKDEIEYADLRYKELSEKSGVPERALYNYVATNNPSMPPADVAVKIAEALGVSVEYLVTGNSTVSEKDKNKLKMMKILENRKTCDFINSYIQLSERDQKLVLKLIHDMLSES